MAQDIQKEKKETQNEIHFDYKNVTLLAEYINPHARILNHRRTNLSARKQRELATAIKRARFMALMPYTTQ
jgi:small subunit ribosomal protein S18